MKRHLKQHSSKNSNQKQQHQKKSSSSFKKQQPSKGFSSQHGTRPNSPQHLQKQHVQKQPGGTIIGTVKRHPDGYGFFIPEDTNLPDVYIAKHSMVGVMTNDKIEIMVKRDGDRYRGDIVRVVERKTKKVQGQLKCFNTSQGVLRDESFAWGEDLKVTWAPTMQPKDRDWVVVKITSFPDEVRGFQGTVDAIIGDISDPLNDNTRILAANNIPNQFSQKALAEARSLPTEVHESEWRGRKDLRDKKFITIDGRTAKDFDDAIYVEKMQTGFRLWVAIADVSHYVREGTAIDREAYERGTSTYFPNFVSPMLPEALSNELCSLKPNVPRLALVAQMDLDFEGNMSANTFYEAVINSNARVIYGEAQEVIDGSPPDKLMHVAKEIKLAGELAHILMKKRFQDGSLNLEIPESTIEVNEAGVPVDIIRAERIFAHRLIEELMLAANVAVAKFLTSKNAPSIYRVHESPKQEALETLERFLDVFGFQGKLGGSKLQKRITEALEAFYGRPEETVVNILTLRSMSQAKYSPKNVGHFGLGFEDYTHFTSPIRRYPDLIVHRLIKASIGVPGYKRMGMDQLEEAGTMLSGCEQRSVKAERQIQSIKKARFLEKHLGEELAGIISSVAKFGVFVTLRLYDVDGLVKIEELGNDHFEFDEEHLRLKGRRSGKTFAIGDEITIQVAAADHQTGKVDFVLPRGEEDKHARTDKNQSHKERRKAEDHRGRDGEVRVSRHPRANKSSSNHPSGKTRPSRHK